jgi:outer membrane protein assembly factor BamD
MKQTSLFRFPLYQHLSKFFQQNWSLPALPFAFCLLFFLPGCETPEKVLKSTDLEYKKAKAIFWYNKKEYFKCIPVFEELIGLMKGRESVEELYYMYCMANYKQGDYLISAYHFKNFYDQYTNSPKAEECLYMWAQSNEQQSPKPELDQTFTYKALDAYQFFLNMFPDSKYLNESNAAITKLRKKLEKKALNNAELYYRTQNYKAAATTYENLLHDFPDIEENERISFMIVKANYMFASNSVPQRKTERFKHVITSYADFKYRFPTSKYLEEATRYEVKAHYQAVKSAFEWAEICPLNERERQFRLAFAEAEAQKPFITDPAQLNDLNEWVEKGHFLIVKAYFLLSEEKRDSQKVGALEQTVKSYYNFVDLFPKSRYIREAERIFNNSTEQIKKIKSNG